MKDFALKVIKSANLAYAGAIDEKGYPTVKAMNWNKKYFETPNTFYFASNHGSLRAKLWQKNPKATLYFNKGFHGVMLWGKMEVLDTPQLRQKLWTPLSNFVYRNGGKNDPDYCILKFTAEKGRCYSNFSSENFAI
ncbi:pyridoxamine 5'-phosphate oxidase family protein [Candidatus Saccharibacteria bacterium]|nr:pyridoxamine 5'-phosphate oxidase family protein [Candidatus Saccharibacteria bacterium]